MVSTKTMESLKRDANRVMDHLRRLLDTQRSNVPLHLSHYTSTAALTSMLTSSDGGLRLWDSATMNDPDEGSTTSEGEMLLDVLNDDFGEGSWLWHRYAIAHIGCFVGTTRGEGGAVGYRVIDVGDDLLFWRLYGDQCRGLSLTMPPHVCGPLLGTSVVQKVTYRDEPPMPTNRRDVVGVLREVDRLRHQGLETGAWPEMQQGVIRLLDRLFVKRFLHKRSHYEMEQEYRAVVFAGREEDDVAPSTPIVRRGSQIRGGVERTWVQIPEFDRQGIFTTNSQITIGSNVPSADNVRVELVGMLERLGKDPHVIQIVFHRFAIDRAEVKVSRLSEGW